MVRLLGFVALIALVALVLLWSAERFAPPAPEKAAAPAPDGQQAIPRPAPARTPPPPSEVAVAAADAGGTAPRPAPTPPDREAPSPPADPPAAEGPAGTGTTERAEARTDAPDGTRDDARESPPATPRETAPAATAAAGDPRTEPPAAPDGTPEAVAAAEDRAADPAAARSTKPPDEPAQDIASAPNPAAQRPASPSGTARSAAATRSSPASPAPRAETPASEASPASAPSPASGSSPAPASSPASDPSPSPDGATTAYARPGTPAADRSGAAGARIEERLIAEEEFVALEQAQGLIDERTDAQRRRQEEDGWYGWGVLNEYADPDRAARLLGGVPVVRAGDHFHTVRERAGRIRVRPIANVSAAYGAIGLRAHDAALEQLVRRALASGLLLGREADHEFLHLFPRREAAHLGNKVVKVFECHVRESGLRGEAAERFRKQAKLRGAVVALLRANGGRLGVLLPRYFRTGEGRIPVAAPCREIDEESRRAALAMAAPPAAPAASGGG